jgi:uncharacterized protein YecT (DUF1311 family)
MKKIVVFLTLMLSLGLVGCGSRVAKEGKAEEVNTGVEDKVKVNEEVDNSIVQLSNLIDEKKYDNAKVLIEELKSKRLDDAKKADVDKLKERIDLELAKIGKDKKKQEYRTKLDNIEIGLKDLTEKGFSGTTLDMRMAQDESYRRWDDALNEIYNVLKIQLSSSDMKKLQSEETQWISNRDAKAKEASLEMKGGTMEPVLYVGSVTDTTKKRCYELVEKYIE